ncbi:Formation of crista junctions protein 1 [Mortierella claussenii]|nr:Formation of crista junctions protein 1 [Mortierella claussenii]
MLNVNRLASASSKHTARVASSVRATQYRALAQRFNSTDAKMTMPEAAAATPVAKSGLRFRTKALLTLTLLGAGVGGVVKHAFDDPAFRTLLEDNVPYFAHSMDQLEAIKDNKDYEKYIEGASVVSEKAIDLSKTAYRKASDLINGTTTPAPEKANAATNSLTKKVLELEQPKPAVAPKRAEYIPSEVPPPAFLPGAAPGKPAQPLDALKAVEAKVAQTVEDVKEKVVEAKDKAVVKATEVKDKAVVKATEVKDKAVEVKDKIIDKVVEKKEEAVAAIPEPPKKLIKVAPIESEEPIMSNLNTTLHQLVAILNETGIPEQGHQVFEKANEELKHLSERVEALKVEGEAQAATVMAELTEKYNKLVSEKETEHEGELSQLKKELAETFEKEKKKAIEQELQIQQNILKEEQKQELMKYATEMQRRWVREVKVRVENERGGRLARLDQINLRLRTLERQGIDNAQFLEQSARTHQLWCGIKALEKAYEAGERRPFDRELARLKRLAESEKDADVLKAVLAAVPESAAFQGVDSVPELMDRFEYVADKVRQASLVPENGGVLAHGMSVVLSKLMFKKYGLVPGNDVEAILARTEYYLQENDLEQAVRELNQLKGWGKRLAKDWIVAARRRVEVGQAIDKESTQNMVNAQSELMIKAQALMKQKDDIEAEMRKVQDELKSLKNDHKAIMIQIEEALHAVHAEALAERQLREAEKKKNEESSRPSPTSEAGSSASQQPQYEDERSMAPFARVNAVAPDSPAKEAGLLQGDRIVVFGNVNLQTPNAMPSLSEHVQSKENKPILVKVLRGESSELQSLILVPKQGWGGRGLLGCHIVPV